MAKSKLKIRWALSLAISSLLSAGDSLAEGWHNVALQGPATPVAVGQTIDVKVYLGAAGDARPMVALDLILGWNPAHLEFMGFSQAGAVPLMSAYLPEPGSDYTGINETQTPKDGDALFYGLAQLGNPILIGSEAKLFTTLHFKVLSAFGQTEVQAIRELNKAYLAQTAVWDGIVPGLDSTAMLFGAQIFGQGNVATPHADDIATPPAQTQVNNNLTQVFGCATVRSLTRHGGPSDGSGTAQAVMSFLGFFLFLYGMTQLSKRPSPLLAQYPSWRTMLPVLEGSTD